ncbi:MAG: phosphotransferase [Patescibacteria group bacterium]|jgi:hypothetical protein
MNNNPTFRKVCRSPEQAAKERATLGLLQSSTLKPLSPRLVEMQVDPLVVEMSLIRGNAPTSNQLNGQILGQLGVALRSLHDLRSYAVFGSLDCTLEIPLSFTTFEHFLMMQIKKWSEWHKPQQGSFLSSYVSRLYQRCHGLSEYFHNVKPVFCHGDVDLKNILIQDGEVTGIVDWEHAGVYCLAWELRKLPRTLRHNWQWSQLLSSYNNSIQLNQHTLLAAIRYLNAVDLLGHLRWCRSRKLQEEERKTLQQMYRMMNSKEVIK